MQNPNRLKILQTIVCLGFLGGILFSRELWFPIARTFPRAPLFFDLPPDEWLSIIERSLGSLLILSLAAVIFFARLRRFACLAALAFGLLLISFDQTRLQPWVYQYLLLLAVFALREPQPGEAESETNFTLGLLQILIAALYIWSGVQKLNYTFSHETLPFLLAPLKNFLPGVEPPLVFPGIAMALFETLIGCGLLFPPTRKFSMGAAMAMHLIILSLLIAKDYNRIVWIWNAALTAIVFISFWQTGGISLKQTIWKSGGGWREKPAKLIVATSVLLPILSFWGWWDMYLSGALYSGSVETAVVRLNEDAFEKLPPQARQNVFQLKNSGAKMLPLFEWAMTDLNVPVYPEKRVFKRAAGEVCNLTNDQSRIELIIKERPAILDGGYKVTQIDCAELENP